MRAKNILLIIVTILITSFSGCYGHYSIYYEERAALTQVSYTMFGVSTDFYTSDYISLEEDSYKRQLYAMRCWDKVDFNDNNDLIYVGITQLVDDEFAYYYPGEQYYLLVEDINLITDEEVSLLKERNDWDQPLSLNKCIKKELIYYSQKGKYNEQKVLKEVTKQVNIDFKHYSVYYSDTDLNGQQLYAIEFISVDDINIPTHIVYAVIMNSKSNEKVPITLINSSDYREELQYFKEINNWQYDYGVEE